MLIWVTPKVKHHTKHVQFVNTLEFNGKIHY